MAVAAARRAVERVRASIDPDHPATNYITHLDAGRCDRQEPTRLECAMGQPLGAECPARRCEIMGAS